MLKLVKYEFRKARAALLTLIGVTVALEITFLVSLALEKNDFMLGSLFALALCAYAVAVFVLVRGVTSYSRELKDRSSYLIFLTPNSCLKIVASKFLYTVFNSLIFMAAAAALAGFDFTLVLKHYGEYERFFEGIKTVLSIYGVYVDQILYFVLFILIYSLLSILSVIAIAYFAITVSHTLFRDKKWRWLPALILFLLLSWGVNYIESRFPSPLVQMELFSLNLNGSTISTPEVQAAAKDAVDTLKNVIIPSLLPSAATSLAVLLASMFGCAFLLERKVSL